MSKPAIQHRDGDLSSTLAPYATDWRESKGRFFDEPASMDRTPFQRDRDRIVHSDAFRRLQYKTQVFLNTLQGDFRTRLTHTLEVAQLTRTICRALQLDEDLGETVALAHDLGHPPFGHAGEDALDACMQPFGGFRHNEQTLRVVRNLECRYGQFDGLNLTWESLEGIAKHNGPITGAEGELDVWKELEPHTMCGMEAQVAAVCDDMAYNHHDLEDGLANGSFHIEDVLELEQFRRVWEEVNAMYPHIDEYRKLKETMRRMIGRQVKDLLNVTRVNLLRHKPQSAQEVRAMSQPLVQFSEKTQEEIAELKAFLMKKMYRHYRQNRNSFRAHKIIRGLFAAFFEHRLMLPTFVQKQLPEDKTDDVAKARVICDYICNMTDRSAMHEYSQLFGAQSKQF